MYTIPSLDPRGSQSVPRRKVVRVSEVLIGLGTFRFFLWLLDMIGRGESAIDIYRFLPKVLSFLGHPAFSGCAAAVGFALLWLTAKNSERITTSVLVHPYTKQPFTRPIYPAFRRAALACLAASIVAVLVCLCYKTQLRSYILIEELPHAGVSGPPAPEPSTLLPPVDSKPKPRPTPALTLAEPPGNPKPSSSSASQYLPLTPPGQSSAPKTQLERLTEGNRGLAKADRDRLAEALFEFAQVLDQAEAVEKNSTLKAQHLHRLGMMVQLLETSSFTGTNCRK